MVRVGLFSINLVLLGGALYFVSSSNAASEVVNPQVALVATESSGSDRISSPLDQLSSTEIAVHVSRMAHMETAVAVTNQADSVSSRSAIVSHDDAVVSKPQIMHTDIKTKDDIVFYTVKEGDTVGDLASRFNVTSDSIRWSNDLASWESLRAGQELVIPPINGIVHTVAANDTPASLAQTYQADKQQIISFNDAEIDGLTVGEHIVIPDGEQRVQRTAVTNTYSWFGGGTASYGSHNGYTFGYCTWHAANRRAAAGNPIPNNLGHARTWGPNAQRFGMTVTENPSAGDVLWHKDTSIAFGLGHVGYVEAVHEDGSITVSDMNYPYWNAVTHRTVSPSEFGRYLFIK